MPRQTEFVTLVLELIAPVGSASARYMFGGHGIYIESQIIGLVIDDTLYFKTDDESRKLFEERGLEPFSYAARGKTVAICYFRAPEEALDSPHEMQPWARAALAAALRTAVAKKPRKKTVAGKAKPKPKSLTTRKR